jgi:hypothetical protein
MMALPPQSEEVELESLLAALGDRSPKVAHAACARLESEFVVPRDRLWTLLATASRSHTRSCVVRLLARGERIDSMTWLLNAIAMGDRAVREQACRHLMRWGDTWPRVTLQRLAAFRVALARVSAVLPKDLHDRLWAFVHHVDGKGTQVQPQPQALRKAQVRAQVKALMMSRGMALLPPPGTSVRVEAPEPPPPPLPGCVVRRRYELPPRRRAPWRWILS